MPFLQLVQGVFKVKVIESTSNSLIKNIKKLKNKKERVEKGLYIAEGIKCCLEAFRYKPEKVKCVFVRNDCEAEDFKDKFETFSVSDAVMDSITEAKTPQGIAAVMETENIKPDFTKDTAVYLDCVKDPGNVGGIIRCADAAGFGCVVLSKECADLYNSKTVRSSMGSMFHIPVICEDEYLSYLKQFKENGFSILAGSLTAEKSLYDTDLTGKTVICIGNEAHGISDELYALDTLNIKIPIRGQAESLNACVAAGIVMYEALRQRYGR